MKFKKLAALLGILAVLAALAVFKKSDLKKELAKTQTTAVVETILDSEFNDAFVEKIILWKGGAERLALSKKKDGQWFLENFYGARVKKWTIDNLLKNLSRLKGELRSENKEVLEDYALSDAQAIHVQLIGWEGAEKAHLLVSPQRPNGGQNFVRLSGSPKVYMSFTDLLSALGLYSKEAALNYKTFADLQVMKFDSSKILRLELADKGVTLAKKEALPNNSAPWTFEPEGSHGRVDPAKVSQILSTISNLYAKEVVEPKEAGYGMGGKRPWLCLEYLEQGSTKRLELYLGQYNKDKKCYTVKTMPEGVFYEVDEAPLEALRKDRQFFTMSNP